MFFDLRPGALERRHAWLADVNPDLVGCYRTVRDNTEAVIARAQAAPGGASRRAATPSITTIRDQRFNPERVGRCRRRAGGRGAAVHAGLAAMLIFLNRTGFNGLFRLNRRARSTCRSAATLSRGSAMPDHVLAVCGGVASDRVTIECVPFDDVL